VFVADQRHVPYGEKTSSQLRRYTSAITRFLLTHRCKAVVVACNTGTVYAIEHLRASFAVPFVGTVPAIKPAAARSRSRVVAILSTPATAASPALKKLVRDHAADVRVLRIGCPGLEELVEHGTVSGDELDRALRNHLKPALRAGADVIVLGCTHYPFFGRRIASLSHATVIDSGRAIARQTARVLAQAGLLRQRGVGNVRWYTNGSPAAFARVASKLLGAPVRARRARC
jgi:glutamate racemase